MEGLTFGDAWGAASSTVFSKVLFNSQPTANVTVAVTTALTAVSAIDILTAAADALSCGLMSPAFFMRM